MDEIQKKQERVVGDAFINWYNAEHGRNFVFDRRPDQAPDLMYRDGEEVLQVEVGQAYYDVLDAAFKWKGARGDSDAPKEWHGVNFDDALIEHLNKIIIEKCMKRYGSKCALVVNVDPPITGIDEIGARLGEIRIPHPNLFAGIYLTGFFGQDILHPDRPSGFRCWKLDQQVSPRTPCQSS